MTSAKDPRVLDPKLEHLGSAIKVTALQSLVHNLVPFNRMKIYSLEWIYLLKSFLLPAQGEMESWKSACKAGQLRQPNQIIRTKLYSAPYS